MRVVFADAFYFIALLNEKDEAHARAKAIGVEVFDRLVTTEYVVTEVGDALATTSVRRKFAAFIEHLRTSRNIQFISSDSEWFDAGVKEYSSRPDKAWSLTDCISFEIMRRKKITDALTADHHFTQAGFRILL